MPIGLTEDLKSRMRQRIRHDADLDADWLVGHQAGEMLRLGAREFAARGARLLRQIEACCEPVAEEALHLGGGDEIDDGRLASAKALFAQPQHRYHLLDLFERALAAFELVGNALAQDALEGAV